MATTNDTAQFDTFDASDYSVGIAVGQFNKQYTEAILEHATQTLEEYEVPSDAIHIIRVAGSMEVPVALQKMAQSGSYDCLVAIGVIIQGESAHFDYVAKTITDGVLRVGLDNSMPIGFGVLTVYNSEQAEKRTTVGSDAAKAALHTVKDIKAI